jgi:ABC-2 type transport system permease protein
MFNRIYAIIKKEYKQVLRDPVTLFIVLIFPVFLLILFGYALNFDVDDIQLGIYDQDKSSFSREFINSLTSSGYFKAVKYIQDQNEVTRSLDMQEVQCVAVIPKEINEKFSRGENVKIQYLIDGVNGNTAIIIMNYVNAATSTISSRYINEAFMKSGIKYDMPLDYEPVFWFNPELNTKPFMLTGLIAVILVTLGVILTALGIVREKETGTIEQLNVSPLSPIELLLGKIVPYAVLSLLIAALIIITGWLIFNVEIKGSYFLLLISTIIYLFAALSMGIFVSAISESQQVAFQLGTVLSQLPANLLSGFIFPIESMPPVIQVITNITPAKFYIIALRSIIIKSVGLEAFWEQLVYMFIFGITLLLLAAVRIKKKDNH